MVARPGGGRVGGSSSRTAPEYWVQWLTATWLAAERTLLTTAGAAGREGGRVPQSAIASQRRYVTERPAAAAAALTRDHVTQQLCVERVPARDDRRDGDAEDGRVRAPVGDAPERDVLVCEDEGSDEPPQAEEHGNVDELEAAAAGAGAGATAQGREGEGGDEQAPRAVGRRGGGAILAAPVHEACADVGHTEQGHRGRAEHERGRELRHSKRVAQVVSREGAKREGYGHLGAEEQKVALEVV